MSTPDQSKNRVGSNVTFVQSMGSDDKVTLLPTLFFDLVSTFGSTHTFTQAATL